jgi:hypothetical protein
MMLDPAGVGDHVDAPRSSVDGMQGAQPRCTFGALIGGEHVTLGSKRVVLP